MSTTAIVVGVLGFIVIAFALIGLFVTLFMRADRRRSEKQEPPAPPTLHEVYAADQDHWDKRYQQALMDGLGDECCLCDQPSGKYLCLIHRAPRNHPPLSYIQREAAEHRKRTPR